MAIQVALAVAPVAVRFNEEKDPNSDFEEQNSELGFFLQLSFDIM